MIDARCSGLEPGLYRPQFALAGLLSLDLPFADVATPVDLAAAVLLPNNSAALPAYRLAVDLELSEETS